MKMNECLKLVQLSSAKGGIKATEISKKLGIHKTTVHKILFSFKLRGQIESDEGLWKSKNGQQTIIPIEKEIIIELPTPQDKLEAMLITELLINEAKKHGFPRVENTYRTIYKNLKETRIIRITGKNVNDLELQKIAELIQQANKKSSKINLKKLFKNLKPPT